MNNGNEARAQKSPYRRPMQSRMTRLAARSHVCTTIQQKLADFKMTPIGGNLQESVVRSRTNRIEKDRERTF
jgi:hypothetical protein